MLSLHLKRLEIQGFKSFAEKTEIDFKNGVTAIVGPNGSGKSNISDGIRWVLGEQSIKTLRGSKMEDVIFAGTDKRKPLGFAEVTIVMDNEDGKIPLEYAEVSITRRMFRSGESEYYINKNSCRLKDIRELFMDTGVGKDGYSIIGQGRVDEILSTKSEDRRNIFEEAAGIVKYKSRKEEAEKKLDKTEENLIRINDIVSELENQIGPLEEQSNTAKGYLDLANRLKELEVNLFIREIDRLKGHISNINIQKVNLDEQIGINNNEKEKIEGKYNTLKAQIEEMDKSIENLQSIKYNKQSSIDKKENEIVLYDEKEKFILKEKERLELDLKKYEESRSGLIIEREKINDSCSDISNMLVVLNNKLDEQNAILIEIINDLTFNEKDIEKKKDDIIQNYNLMTDKRSKINNLLVFLDNIVGRIKQVQKEINELGKSKEENLKVIDGILLEEASKDEELKRLSKYQKDLQLDEENIKDKLEKLSIEVDNLKETLHGKISNFNLLSNMEKEYEGFYKSVKSVLLECKKNLILNKGVMGVVAELIKVDEKYEKAIEVALGSNLQNIVTKTEEDAKKIIEYLRKNKLGRVTFLPMTSIKGKKLNINLGKENDAGYIGIASELVSYNKVYERIFDYLLGRTIVVENIDYGVAIAKKYNYSFKIVTLDGDVLNPGGSITGGSLSTNSTNILNRKNKINDLNKEIVKLKEEQKILEVKFSQYKNELDCTIQKISSNNDNIQNVNIDMIKLENERTKLLENNNKIEEDKNRFEEEIFKLSKEIEEINEKKQNLEAELNDLEKGSNFNQESVNTLIKTFEEKKENKDKMLGQITNLKIEITSHENRINANTEKIEAINIQIQEILKNIEKAKMEFNTNLSELDEIKRLKKEISEEKNLLVQSLTESTRKLEELKEVKNKFMDNFYYEQEKLKEINQKIYELEKSLNGLDVKYERNNMQIENYIDRLLNDYDLTYEEAVKLRKEIDNNMKVQSEIRDLKEAIKNLGTVNLGAIEEFKRIKERLDFIKNQREDLLSAKRDLNEVIKDMEQKMKEKFIQNFREIRANFNIVFSELFGGGKADVYLLDEENVLTSGIEIIAQPPGKKLQSLSLLSGGEKSLTAVALLFAVLKTKPTPFCILDEIDAALDDANINRYTTYLKKFADDTQFIIITHRKNTMEIADILYGVTMEEEGISQLVSVKLTDKWTEKAS